MKTALTRDWVQQLLVRAGADAVLVNLALLIALVLRIILPAAASSSVADVRGPFITVYFSNAALLTAVSLIVFYLNGFYTYGRAYRSRFKIVIVIQAVSLSFLIFGFLNYFTLGQLNLPRGALVMAWPATITLLVLSRIWTSLWTQVQQVDSRLLSGGSRRTETVLVIGGAGYIGSALLPKLLREGYHVRLLDLLLFGEEPIQDVISHPRLEVMQADFRRVDAVVAAMHGVDAVVHLGAIVGDPACSVDETLTIEVNLNATNMIADVAKASKVERFIFASTCSVYGAGDEVLDELSSPSPLSLYARSKLSCERGLETMCDSQFASTILRFGTIYGFSGRIRFDLVVNLLAAKAKFDGVITVHGGNQWRPFLHVDDAARSILLVLRAPKQLVNRQIFNVGSNRQNFTIQRVAEIIRERVPAQMVIEDAMTDPRDYRVDFSKIEKVLGFEPIWTLETGVEQVLEAIASGQIEDYREAQYSNELYLKNTNGSHFAQTGDSAFRSHFETLDAS